MKRFNERLTNLYANVHCSREAGGASVDFLSLVFFGLVFYFLVVCLLSLWTDRNLEYMLSEIKNRPVEVHGGLSFLATLLAPAALLFNVIVEIYRAA